MIIIITKKAYSITVALLVINEKKLYFENILNKKGK